MPQALATPQELANYLGGNTTVEQLAQYRYLGTGPRFIKVGKNVRYRWSDVEVWLDANTKQSTDERTGAA